MTTKPLQVRFLTLGLLASAVACGGDDLTKVPPLTGGGGAGPTVRTSPDGAVPPDAVVGEDGGAMDLDAPVSNLPEGVKAEVTFFAPVASAVVKTAETFKPMVKLEMSANSLADLPGVNGVQVEVVPAGPITTPRPRITLPQLGMPSFDADAGATVVFNFGDVPVPIDDLKSGKVKLIAVADLTGGASVRTETEVTLDAGPEILFVNPQAENTSFKGSVRIEVTIADPTFAPVEDISFALGTTALVVENSAEGLYASTINFASFNPPLTGEQLVTVRASNANGTIKVVSRKFLADDQGPKFEMLTPTKGQLIGGIIEVSAVVSDPARVQPNSVVAIIGNGADIKFEVRLNPPPAGSMVQKYSKLFDAKLLPVTAIFPTVSFRASDTLGNESTEGYLVSLDSMPPLLDLDPPHDFRFNVEFSGSYNCSWPFDPVGPDAVDDGQLVNQAFDVRVRAEDQGNQVASGSIDFVPIAGVKKVELLVLDNTERSLVVDSDDDGRCDAINPLLVPTTRPTGANDILLLGLEPLLPAGTPDNFPELPLPVCRTGGLNTTVRPVCDSVAPTYNPWKAKYRYENTFLTEHGHFMSVFTHYTQERLPSIWTPGPVRSGVECAGRQLEAVGSNLKDGWICVAALAEDTLGQKQVSRPIRVCVDHDSQGNECPHVRVNAVMPSDPVEVETQTNHGLNTGDEVYLQGAICQTQANGKHKVTVTGARTFTLDGVAGRTDHFPALPFCQSGAENGFVVPAKLMPDCTGKQTQKEPTAVVDDTAACSPWRSFPRGEFRYFR